MAAYEPDGSNGDLDALGYVYVSQAVNGYPVTAKDALSPQAIIDRPRQNHDEGYPGSLAFFPKSGKRRQNLGGRIG